MIKVQIAGRLGKDPETRFTTGGQKVTNLTVATNIRKAGKEETVWWRVTLWGDRFDKLMPYLKKGSSVIASGDMHKPEVYTDKEGRPQPSCELTADSINFNPFGTQEGGATNQTSQSGYGTQAQAPSQSQPQSNYGQAAPQSNYGNEGDFNGASSGGARYSEQNEDPIPF